MTGPESFHTTMLLTVDVRVPLPSWIVNLATKKVVMDGRTKHSGRCVGSSKIHYSFLPDEYATTIRYHHNHDEQVAGLFLYLISKETRKYVLSLT